MSFLKDVIGLNPNNSIYCDKKVILGNPSSTDTGAINIVGLGGREISINGVIPSSGGGSLPSDATFDNLTINTSIVNNGTQTQTGKITTNDIDCNGDILLPINKSVTADNLIARVNVGTANVSTGDLTTTGINTIGGTFNCSSVPATFSGGLSIDAGITVNTGNVELSSATAEFKGAKLDLTDSINCTNITCDRGTEVQRFLVVPRMFFRFSGGWGINQSSAGNLLNDLIATPGTAGGRFMFTKAGGNTGLDANQNVIIEDSGKVRVDTAVEVPKISFAKDSTVTPCYSIEQPIPSPTNPNPELQIQAPTADSLIIVLDELGNSLLEIEKDIIVVHNGIELIDNSTLSFGDYGFNPVQLTRTISQYAIVTTPIPAGAPTQIPIFETGSVALGATNDWVNVNTGDSGQVLSDLGFYKVTLSGDSIAGAPPYMNDFMCMFDFCFRTCQDAAPRVTIPVNTMSFGAMQPDPTTVGSVPIITCTPGNTNWKVFINFPTFPAMTIPNLVIKVTKMPY